MRHTKAFAVIAGVLTCAIGAMAQAGDVYKYVDERGNTLYTDKPIPGAVLREHRRAASRRSRGAHAYAAQPVRHQCISSPPATSASPTRRTDTRVAATVAKDLEATRAERCKKARENYQTSINSQRLYRTDARWQARIPDRRRTRPAAHRSAKEVDSICGPQG